MKTYKVRLVKPHSIWNAGIVFKDIDGMWRESGSNVFGISHRQMELLLQSKHAEILNETKL